jgi:tRNA-Thr(GGU) m(6)t(6)A37 methyltransferase TsaA
LSIEDKKRSNGERAVAESRHDDVTGGEKIVFSPIGIIHSEHVRPDETPIQPVFAHQCPGSAVLFPEYAEGLNDIEGFSHLFLLYHFHRSGPCSLLVKPFLDDTFRGLFATRHPCRPNGIGLSIVRLIRREGATLYLEDVDILDGTPLLDIKPFLPVSDVPKDVRGGWTERLDPDESRRRGRRGYRGSKRHEDGEGQS